MGRQNRSVGHIRPELQADRHRHVGHIQSEVGDGAFFALASAKPIKERENAKKKEREKSESAERERKKARIRAFPPPTVETGFRAQSRSAVGKPGS
jgi:hypothetical protein